MFAEVISIGDELTSGERLDTNSQWLSQRLGELGVRTIWHTTIADHLEANVEVFRIALQRADLIVCTGGLGPTADDLTRQALSLATDRPLVRDAAALEQIATLFAKRGRTMPERNAVQADFPQGSIVIPNPHGTAPGIDLTQVRSTGQSSRIFCLPGVPAEMKEMWSATVQPAIQQLVGPTQVIRHRVIKCFGAGESELEAMLPDLIRRGRDPQVGITVHQATITLRISAQAESADAAYAKMDSTVDVIYQTLGELVFGDESDELQHAVTKLLTNHQQSLCTVEIGTAGIISRWFGELETAKTVYRGGAMLHTTEKQPTWLDTLADQQRTPQQIVAAIANKARSDWQTDWALVTGPVFMPADSEIPRIVFALAGAERTLTIEQSFTGHPEILVPRAAKQALNMLRLKLLRG
jgi:nicotinamide-nucleotide amidase